MNMSFFADGRNNVIAGSYDYRLVALSLMIAVLTSYTAFDLAGRVMANRGFAKLTWLIGGAFSMGSGIWCMHYIGMLAFRLPIQVYYHVPTVEFSLFAAIVASGIALYVVSSERLRIGRLIVGGIFMGGGIATMHYTGMAAMRMRAMHQYNRGLWVLSVVLAVAISIAGLLIIFYNRAEKHGWMRKLTASLAMGLAIPIMHYTGMAAVTFVPLASEPNLRHSMDISVVANVAILIVTVLVLGLSLAVTLVDRHFSAQQLVLDSERKMLRALIDNVPDFMYVKDMDGRFLIANPAVAAAVGVRHIRSVIGKRDLDFFPRELADLYVEEERQIMVSGKVLFNHEETSRDAEGNEIPVLVTKVPLRDHKGQITGIVAVGRDISERKKNDEALRIAREQLAHAQKLESVGQLAAGIAHEINTPIQFIGDNVRFLKETFHELTELLEIYGHLLSAAREGTLDLAAIAEADRATRKIDLVYLLQEIPGAVDQTLEGVGRVATLVSAMKEFSHPGTVNKIPLDLNHAIQSTITVARNEWKYVAEMETRFDPALPLISCQPGEFNQAILNLIVNAAHAIAEKNASNGERGNITVETKDMKDGVEIRVEDTGAGIPVNVRARIFDPFFTTKEIGKGTGQGLAITRSVIVDKHFGSIDFETIEGEGTTFIIRLPHDSMSSKAEVMIQ